MQALRFSIVTPSFNQARFLEATIVSIVNQDYPRIDYAIYDGGSTDDSVSIIKRYAHRLSTWESKPDRGQADAIARGFAAARGDVLGWVNSDDVLLPGCLSRVAAEFDRHPDVGFVYGSRLVIDKEGREIGRYSPPTILGKRYFEFGQWIPQECAFWRRSVYEAAGGVDASLFFCLDYSLFVRMWPLTRFRRIGTPLGALRVHGESKTARSAAVLEQEAEAIRSRYNLDRRRPKFLRRSFELAIYAQAAVERLIRRG